MKKISKYYLLIFALFLFSCNSNDSQLGNVELETKYDSIFYCIGINIAEQFTENSIETGNPLAIAQGLDDFINQNESLIADADKLRLLGELNQSIDKVQQEKGMREMEKNRYEGTSFLIENKKKEGVIELESGLQYKIIKEGQGSLPKISDTVSVHYKGTLLDGTKFDASYDWGQPAIFPVNGVIKGWTEGLLLMKIGAIYQLFIPADLAYGDRAVGPKIKPGSTLIFEVELISIKPGNTLTNPR